MPANSPQKLFFSCLELVSAGQPRGLPSGWLPAPKPCAERVGGAVGVGGVFRRIDRAVEGVRVLPAQAHKASGVESLILRNEFNV